MLMIADVVPAVLVLNRGLRRHEECLLWKVDRDLRTLIVGSTCQAEELDAAFIPSKEHFEVVTRPVSLSHAWTVA